MIVWRWTPLKKPEEQAGLDLGLFEPKKRRFLFLRSTMQTCSLLKDHTDCDQTSLNFHSSENRDGLRPQTGLITWVLWASQEENSFKNSVISAQMFDSTRGKEQTNPHYRAVLWGVMACWTAWVSGKSSPSFPLHHWRNCIVSCSSQHRFQTSSCTLTAAEHGILDIYPTVHDQEICSVYGIDLIISSTLHLQDNVKRNVPLTLSITASSVLTFFSFYIKSGV